MPTNYLPKYFNISNVFNANITIPCPDQYVGTFTHGGNPPYQSVQRVDIDYDYSNGQPIINNLLPNQNRIVVILESPHKDEFDSSSKNATANGPAWGKTGERFKQHFANIFSSSQSYSAWKIVDDDCYDVILMNSVQFQCSLGDSLFRYKNRIQRDKHWIHCMLDNTIQNDFLDRVKALDPCILINLCTVGIMDLQSNVDMVLKPLISAKKYRYTSGRHPSSWLWKKNRVII